MIAKNFGEIPAAGPLEPIDEAILAQVRGAFDTVGGLIARHRQRGAIAEAMRVVGEVNAYVSATEPFKLKGEDQRERLGTVLHVLAQCVSDLNLILSPFLPHSSNDVHRVLGGDGTLTPMPRIEEVQDLPDDVEGPEVGLGTYPVITGEYSGFPRWESTPVVAGTPIPKPAPVFTKLDPDVVGEELARLGKAPEPAAESS